MFFLPVNLQPKAKVAIIMPTAILLKIGGIEARFGGFSPLRVWNGWENSAGVA
jgi:hypothetical protein